MGLTLEHIHNAVNKLGRLMPAKPNKASTREYSLKESIFLMAPKLLEMRQMGFTTNELVKALEAEDISIKSPTLNRYLCEYQKIHGEEDESSMGGESVPIPKSAPRKSKSDKAAGAVDEAATASPVEHDLKSVSDEAMNSRRDESAKSAFDERA